MSVATRKISITVEADLLDKVKQRVGSRGVSRFFADAVDRQLDYEDLVDWVAELDAEFGPADPELVQRAIAAMDKAEAAARKTKKAG